VATATGEGAFSGDEDADEAGVIEKNRDLAGLELDLASEPQTMLMASKSGVRLKKETMSQICNKLVTSASCHCFTTAQTALTLLLWTGFLLISLPMPLTPFRRLS
jgi:hypothetical protein